jgi:hypothetical protein
MQSRPLGTRAGQVLRVSLIEVVGDADIPAVVLQVQYIDEGTDDDGFKHLDIL